MSYDSQTNQKQWNKKEIRKNTNKLVRGVLLYELIMFLIVIADITRRIMNTFRNSDFNMDAVLDEAIKSGTSSIIAVILGLAFLFFYFKKSDSRKLVFYTRDKMTGRSFLVLLTVFMSAQAAFSLLGGGMELGFNQFGYSILGEIKDASSNSSTVSMLLYASFIGPVSEEIIFRGFVMRGFEKYGARYAVVMSAVIFGLFHGNMIQSIFAGLVGLILMKKTELRERMKETKIDGGLLGATCSSIWLLIFFAFQLFQGISGIEKLPV
ncbi:CPBP family intramembrane glutamic endopeptidase [Lacrimispora amygdalina]|uniref:CPBP family intramembrane glutamic endopeptidase n=1 Tax=Lacrimispora amygdalina TaxID=253257 RepID=UPI000BE2FAD9|nr:type II CAAX endopeptidase family protein [Lacrimispora amygdalina]